MSNWKPSIEEFCKLNDNAHLLVMRDHEAKDQFEENTIDLIFVDLDGSFEVTERTLRLWKTKLTKQGCICGHDYLFCPEVRQALEQHTTKHYNWNDYWLVKSKDIKVQKVDTSVT